MTEWNWDAGGPGKASVSARTLRPPSRPRLEMSVAPLVVSLAHRHVGQENFSGMFCRRASYSRKTRSQRLRVRPAVTSPITICIVAVDPWVMDRGLQGPAVILANDSQNASRPHDERRRKRRSQASVSRRCVRPQAVCSGSACRLRVVGAARRLMNT